MKIFREIAQLERAAALGALQSGDCVCVAPPVLRALEDEPRRRLAQVLAAAGARLCETSVPETVVVYSTREQCPPECAVPNGAPAPRVAPASRPSCSARGSA